VIFLQRFYLFIFLILYIYFDGTNRHIKKGRPKNPNMEFETRLLQINSDQREDAPGYTSATFGVDIGNVISDLSSIVGISVESCGFTNVVPNLRSTAGNNRLQGKRNGVDFDIEIPGDTFYTIQTLADTLQFFFDSDLPGGPGQFEFTVVPNIGADGGDRLSIQYVLAPEVDLTLFADRQLAYIMGMKEDITIAGAGPHPAILLRTNLQGEAAIGLHSRELLGSRNSILGTGTSNACVATLPLTVPYGLVQTHKFSSDIPFVRYGPYTSPNISNIDISFRYTDDDSVVPLDNTKTFVVFRLWLMSK